MTRLGLAVSLLAVAALVALAWVAPRRAAVPTPTDSVARRIVSLAPSVTEIVQALGATERLVAVSAYCEGVPAELPRVGTLLAPDLEGILAARPDLVLGVASSAQGALFRGLRERGIAVEVHAGDTVADLRETVAALGERLGAEEAARALLTRLDAALAPASRPPAAGAPVVLFVVSHPLWVAGGGSFVDDMIRAAGARNAFGDRPEAWIPVEFEEVVQRRPELVVDTSWGGNPAAGQLEEAWRDEARHLPAVSAGRLYPFPPVRAGARVPDWIEQLRRLVQRSRRGS